jgi:ATP-dependent exoDNAse (exonuclease V) alpha subunit
MKEAALDADKEHKAARDAADAARDQVDMRIAEIAGGRQASRLRSREAQIEQGAEILSRLESRGQVQTADTKQQAITDLVGDWAASEKPTREKIVIAATRDDVQTLNTALRATLQERGEVAREGARLDVVDGGRKADIEVTTGDRIRFGKRDNELGIVNGTVAVVESVERDKQGRLLVSARIDSDIAKENGRGIKFDPEQMRHFGYAYAGTVHKGQGQTKEECYHLAHAGMTDRHLSLVAASRARGSYTMYGAQGDIENIEERLGMDRLRGNALEAGRSREQAPHREQVKEQAREAVTIIRARRERDLAQSM